MSKLKFYVSVSVIFLIAGFIITLYFKRTKNEYTLTAETPKNRITLKFLDNSISEEDLISDDADIHIGHVPSHKLEDYLKRINPEILRLVIKAQRDKIDTLEKQNRKLSDMLNKRSNTDEVDNISK